MEERIEKKSEIRENFSKGFLLSLLDDMRICLEDFSVRSRINLRVCTFCAFTQRETRETSHKAVFMSLIFLRDKGEVKRIFCKKRGRKNFNALCENFRIDIGFSRHVKKKRQRHEVNELLIIILRVMPGWV